MQKTNTQTQSLDICDITGREHEYSANLVTQEEIAIAVSHMKNVLTNIRKIENDRVIPWKQESEIGIGESSFGLIKRRSQDQTFKQWNKEYNYSYRLEVSPGSIKISSKMANPDKERVREKTPNYAKKSNIKEWSPKSRAPHRGN